ncbi:MULTISPECIES: hypothetical protein, partial [unclassified Okeania]|uniref:hypothetical protein n=1 Tax=unclassified Okeania TaxID=2634635 RepID=UPI00257F09BA
WCDRTTPSSILNNGSLLVEVFFSLFDKSISIYSFQLPCHPVSCITQIYATKITGALDSTSGWLLDITKF